MTDLLLGYRWALCDYLTQIRREKNADRRISGGFGLFERQMHVGRE